MVDISQVMTKLIIRSRDGKLKWRETSDERTFMTILGDVGVLIRSIDILNIDHELQIVDGEGRVVEVLSSSRIADGDLKGALRLLYDLARRSAYDTDSTLAELVKQLDSIA